MAKSPVKTQTDEDASPAEDNSAETIKKNPMSIRSDEDSPIIIKPSTSGLEKSNQDPDE